MKLSIHQPSYFPWIGLLDKIAKSDTFILLDDVQVVKGTYQYRNQFYCNGDAKILTLPIDYHLGVDFNKLEFKNNEWGAKHLDTLRNYYLKTPFSIEVYKDLELLYKEFENKPPIQVLDLSMRFCLRKLNINVDFLYSSRIGYQGKKGEMVLDLCTKTGATQYLAGRGSYDYMQDIVPSFKDHNIEIVWHKFAHPVYPQMGNKPFVEGLSVLDLFFFMGYSASSEIFMTNLNSQ